MDDICTGLVGVAHRMWAAVVRRGGAAWCCFVFCVPLSLKDYASSVVQLHVIVHLFKKFPCKD